MGDKPDYPAAHSMDTTWFAVDDEGFVAVFNSFEAGAVPVDAFDSEARFEQAQAFVEQRASDGQAVLDADGLVVPWSTKGQHETRNAWFNNHGATALFFLEDDTPLARWIEAGRAYEIKAKEGRAFVVRGPTRRLSDYLHAANLCRHCCYWYQDEHSAAQQGLYEYEHLTENSISGPYGRAALPSEPFNIAQLPEAIRQELRLVRFEGVRFAQTTHLQPVEHHPSTSWQSSYLTIDGDELPMPEEP